MKLEEGLRIGRLFESECARQLHIANFHVSRTCDQLGLTGTKAPMLTGPFAGHRLPDLDVMGDGDSFWVEAKYKSDWTFYRKDGDKQHGMDWPNWRDYLKVCQISGRRGYLIIGEGRTGLILRAPFAKLEPLGRRYDGDVHFKDGAVFWSREVFQLCGEFSPQTGQMRFNFKSQPLRAGIFAKPKVIA